GLTCGRDDNSSVSVMYRPPFAFRGGTLREVVVDVSGEHLHDEQKERQTVMARQ
ncbi:hypothetical protein HUW62_20255, partial [Myxococcus sp. AM011]|nr:hypothetical protein [Myxococcus sp. AM011]